jgi:glycosyltransferase involved in cell wall biosynthesis
MAMTSVHADPLTDRSVARPAPKIGILVVAYNAASTLANVLDRIPNDFRSRISKVFVCDDASDDSTYLVGLGYQQVTDDLPLTVIRHANNLGYGGNQKAGYQMAIEEELDIIVLLHGDGQYAPEALGDIVAPLERGECDAVFGSRMMKRGDALKGGMPVYKYVGNRILTEVENRMLGIDLSEWHSGYRAYNVRALAAVPFERNSDGFNFDTQIIIQLHDAGKRIKEVPIPTFYGDEICRVDGLRYARDVTRDVARYRLGKLGFIARDTGVVDETSAMRAGAESSHPIIRRWLSQMPPSTILHLGCGSGLLSERARELGHTVVGVDRQEMPGIRDRVDRFVLADLDAGFPAAVRRPGGYDIVLCADVLEHLTEPEALLGQIRPMLTRGGIMIVSVPNVGHWYSRGRIALGTFDYDQRGILDESHMRFFTEKSISRRLTNAGFEIVRRAATGVPVEKLVRRQTGVAKALSRLDGLGVQVRPTLFGYQLVYECASPAPPSLVTLNATDAE